MSKLKERASVELSSREFEFLVQSLCPDRYDLSEEHLIYGILRKLCNAFYVDDGSEMGSYVYIGWGR